MANVLDIKVVCTCIRLIREHNEDWGLAQDEMFGLDMWHQWLITGTILIIGQQQTPQFAITTLILEVVGFGIWRQLHEQMIGLIKSVLTGSCMGKGGGVVVFGLA